MPMPDRRPSNQVRANRRRTVEQIAYSFNQFERRNVLLYATSILVVLYVLNMSMQDGGRSDNTRVFLNKVNDRLREVMLP